MSVDRDREAVRGRLVELLAVRERLAREARYDGEARRELDEIDDEIDACRRTISESQR